MQSVGSQERERVMDAICSWYCSEGDKQVNLYHVMKQKIYIILEHGVPELVSVRGLLGTRLHSRRWAVGKTKSTFSTLARGKIVFHETGPWYQKGWRLLF